MEVIPASVSDEKQEEMNVLVRVQVPEPQDIRAPVDVCCVVDISGSKSIMRTTRLQTD